MGSWLLREIQTSLRRAVAKLRSTIHDKSKLIFSHI